MREHRDKKNSCVQPGTRFVHIARDADISPLCRSKGDGDPSASAAVGLLAQGAESVSAMFARSICVSPNPDLE